MDGHELTQTGEQVTYYPIFLNLKGKTVLVVGGGMVAERKVRTLLEYGADIRLVSRETAPGLKEMSGTGKITYAGPCFEEKHLDGIFLVFAATNDKDLNHRISRIAQSKGILVNAVDQPADCNFIIPAIVRKGDLQIAVSTSGRSPAFAKVMKKRLDYEFGDEYQVFLELMGNIRKEVLSKELPQNINMGIFNRIVQSGIPDLIRKGDWKRIRTILEELLPGDVSTENIIPKRV